MAKLRAAAAFLWGAILLAFPTNGQELSMDSLTEWAVSEVFRNSIYVSGKDTLELRELVRKRASGAQTIEDLRPAFEALLNGLGDYHGRIMRADYTDLARFTAWETLDLSDKRPRDPAVWQIVNRPGRTFEHFRIDKKTALLRLAGIGATADTETEARLIRQAIEDLSDLGVNRWIIDLRYNGGGNMYPMLQGLAPLLGEGVVGYSALADGHIVDTWQFHGGNFAYGEYQPMTWPAPDEQLASQKVAVLTSRYTVSSGEVLAAAFKGRPYTRFFGEATGAMTTVLDWKPIADHVIVSVSIAYYADRNGTVFRVNIPVDEEVPFVPECDWNKDPAVKASLRWLRKKINE